MFIADSSGSAEGGSGMPIRALRLLAMYSARHWLMTFIISLLAVFTVSYFYCTSTHALESFDSTSCKRLALDLPDQSASCVSSLQSLLNDDHLSRAIPVDGSFGGKTQDAVCKFQAAHGLTPDGVVASKTASAINAFSPRPTMLSYAAGFANSKLIPTAKLCVWALVIAVTIGCFLLRAVGDRTSRLPRFGFPLSGVSAGLSAASSAAADTLMTEADGWVDKFLGLILIGLAATLAALFAEFFTLSLSAKHQSSAAEPGMEADYGR
jgi:hypothetical protein